MFKHRVLPILLGLSLHSLASAAPDLLDIYHQAEYADPVLRQAFNQYLSVKENVPQAMANLLPSVNGSAYYDRIDTDVVNGASPLFGGKETYSQWNYTLSVTQPIFNYALWMAEKQASFGARQAQASFSAAQQDLMIRTATAYFNVLRAKDSLGFAKAKKRANFRQLDQAEQRFKVGLDAITSVYEAQAAYDASKSQVIAGKNNLKNQYERLRKLTNQTYTAIAGLNRDHVPLVKPKPANVMSWVNTALNQNYQLIAAKFANEAAHANVKLKNAGHLPTVNFNANYSETKANGVFAPFASDTTSGVMGVSLNFPIFQSGLIESQTRQATFDYRATRDKYEQTYRDTTVNTRIAYNTIIDGISKIRADRQAVKSAQNSAESTEAQFKVGTRTMVDVVTAQQQLFEAQTVLANDQYDYILALLQIKQLAGTLSVDDLVNINHWLSTHRRHH